MAHYSLTPRVKVLAERLLSQKSTLCTEHATTLNALDGDIAGVPAAVKPARRFYELMRQLQPDPQTARGDFPRRERRPSPVRVPVPQPE